MLCLLEPEPEPVLAFLCVCSRVDIVSFGYSHKNIRIPKHLLSIWTQLIIASYFDRSIDRYSKHICHIQTRAYNTHSHSKKIGDNWLCFCLFFVVVVDLSGQFASVCLPIGRSDGQCSVRGRWRSTCVARATIPKLSLLCVCVLFCYWLEPIFGLCIQQKINDLSMIYVRIRNELKQ